MGTAGTHRAGAAGSRLWLVLLLAGTGPAAVALLAGPAGRETAYALVSLALAGAVTAGVRMHRPARPLGWWLLAAGAVSGTAAHCWWAVELVADDGSEPALSWAYAGYFLMYLLTAAAVAVLSSPQRRGAVPAGMSEAGIVAGTATVLAWVFLLDPYVHDRAGY